nr:MAG TPA: hypothetical protein [Caudoviricetes sp.]
MTTSIKQPYSKYIIHLSPLVFGERYYLACHCPESKSRARGVF